METTIELSIFELVFESSFALKKQSNVIFEPNLPKKDTYAQKQESEDYH